jgi:putative DNA primase/helicase
VGKDEDDFEAQYLAQTRGGDPEDYRQPRQRHSASTDMEEPKRLSGDEEAKAKAGALRATEAWKAAYPLTDPRAKLQRFNLERRGLDVEGLELRAIDMTIEFELEEGQRPLRPAILAQLYSTETDQPVGFHATFLTSYGTEKALEPFTYRRTGHGTVYGLILRVKGSDRGVVREGLETVLSLARPNDNAIYTAGVPAAGWTPPQWMKGGTVAVDKDPRGERIGRAIVANVEDIALWTGYRPVAAEDKDINDTLRRLGSVDRDDPAVLERLEGRNLTPVAIAEAYRTLLAGARDKAKKDAGYPFTTSMLKALEWAYDNDLPLFEKTWADLKKELKDRIRVLDRTLKARRAQANAANQRSAVFVNNATALARDFLTRWMNEEKLTLRFWRGDFWRWTGAKWEMLDKDELFGSIWNYCAALDEAATRIRLCAEVIAALKASVLLEAHHNPPFWIVDGGPPVGELVPFANGLLHLPTGQLLPANPLLFNIGASAAHFDPSAPPPRRWLIFLQQNLPDPILGEIEPPSLQTDLKLPPELEINDDEVHQAMLASLMSMNGAPEEQLLLQEYMGYLLSGATNQQKFLMMLGVPRSGRGTILRVIESILGMDNCVPVDVDSLPGEFGLQPLVGKTVAIFHDALIGKHTNRTKLSSILLRIIGEDTSSFNRKHLTFCSGKLGVRFIYVSNQSPKMVDPTGALRARMLMIRFKVSFLGRENKELTQELLQEKAGIINWALEGLQRLQQRGQFRNTLAGLEKIDEIANLSNPMYQFVDDNCELGDAFQEDKNELWNAIRNWKVAEGEEKTKQRLVLPRSI